MAGKRGRRPFGCYKCGTKYSEGLMSVERGGNKRRFHGVDRNVVNVICHSSTCQGREFWSMHPDAIAESRRLDQTTE